MAIRVSPTEARPTHHLSLEGRNGDKVGLILCDENGNPAPRFSKTPVDRTALKTSSGNSSYGDFEYPYSPIAQDDWSGGRASLDLERDTTKYFDSFRLRTGMFNKAFLGPQEQITTGIRSQDNNLPGNVTFFPLVGTRYIAKRFSASASYTATKAWVLARKKGTPGNLTLTVYADSTGQLGTALSSISVATTRLPDILSEWLCETISQALVSGTAYWIGVNGNATDDANNCWEVGVSAAAGTSYVSSAGGAWVNWSAGVVDLYFRLTDAFVENSCNMFKYKELMYAVVSATSGAPKLYKNGDRGSADSNAGNLTKLIDASKSWTVNQWAGCVAFVVDGPGKGEYKNIVSNTATQLVFADSWTTTHTVDTDYVILGSTTWTKITGHGLTAPVKDVIIVTKGSGDDNIVYFAQGEAIDIRKYRAYNNGGVWTEAWRDDVGNTADLLVYKPIAKKIYRAKNGSVKVESGSLVAFTANMSFSGDVYIGDSTRKISRLMCYPDSANEEAIWAFKTDIPYIVPSSNVPYPISIREMEAVQSEKNGVATLVHDVYIYFSMMNGLERYYSGSMDDIGPNLGEGLPIDRQGPIVALTGYPGKFFAAVDAGLSGYSSILERDNNGWHERYRAPLGKRIRTMAIQVIPGNASNRLWVYQGNDIVYLPMPSDSTNELEDSNYRYTHEGSLVFARMHAGMMDIQKIVKTIKLWTDNLAEGVCWIELDYRLNEEDTWTRMTTVFEESPQSRMDFSEVFGMAAKRIQLRLRFYTADATKTPILLSLIVEAVTRIGVKHMYPLMFRVMDDEETLDPHELDEVANALDKYQMVEDWGDDSSDSMVKVEAISGLLHGKLVFVNPPDIKQIAWKDANVENSRDIYVCSTTLQEA